MNRPTLSLSPDVEAKWKAKMAAKADKARRRKERHDRNARVRKLQERGAKPPNPTT